MTTGSGGGGGNSFDPFTGGSRYTGGGVTTGSGEGFVAADPLTGGGSYQSTPAAAPTSKILPVKTYLTFKKINAKAALGKLEQFNQEIAASSVSTFWQRLAMLTVAAGASHG